VFIVTGITIRVDHAFSVEVLLPAG